MIDLEAIRKRDAQTEAPLWFVPMSPDKVVSLAPADRRALLAYVDALREAAGKVTCAWCRVDLDVQGPAACEACDPLRALLNPEVGK